MRFETQALRSIAIALVEGKCPHCDAELIIDQYRCNCPHCQFSANRGSGSTLSEPEENSLLLLAAHAGKVILVYATVKNIEAERTAEIMAHPDFQRGEYQRLLNHYNALAAKCSQLMRRREITLNQLLEGE